MQVSRRVYTTTLNKTIWFNKIVSHSGIAEWVPKRGGRRLQHIILLRNKLWMRFSEFSRLGYVMFTVIVLRTRGEYSVK
jgi:hypothetical protein